MTDEKKPLRVLSLGAGVQSTTLLLMMLEGEIEMADHVIFADTGWEPKPVYEHLEYLKQLIDEAGIPFHMVTAGNIRADALSENSRFASMPLHTMSPEGKKGLVRRQCTNEYKIQPLLKKQRELAGLKKGQRCKDHLITTIIGISWDESQRMRDAAFSWIKNEYPLVDRRITRQDCIDWCESKGYKRPPRSACIGCPFKSDDQWRLLRDEMPEAWADAVEFDNDIRVLLTKKGSRFTSVPYLHSSCTPLDQADLRTNDEKGVMSLFDMECEGMCGL
jgi:hypothetical protein